MKLQEKVAIITGGGRGIGRASALALAKEGAAIVVSARTRSEVEEVAREVRELGSRAIPVEADLSREADIANMGTADYVTALEEIIASAASRLRDNSFAVVVIGNQRNYNKKEPGYKNGELRSLYSITVEAFQKAGMVFYNDVIILNEVGSYSLIGSTIFKGGRKLGRVHQYALVFVKGNWREAHLRSGAACLYDRDPLDDILVEDDGQASLFE